MAEAWGWRPRHPPLHLEVAAAEAAAGVARPPPRLPQGSQRHRPLRPPPRLAPRAAAARVAAPQVAAPQVPPTFSPSGSALTLRAVPGAACCTAMFTGREPMMSMYALARSSCLALPFECLSSRLTSTAATRTLRTTRCGQRWRRRRWSRWGGSSGVHGAITSHVGPVPLSGAPANASLRAAVLTLMTADGFGNRVSTGGAPVIAKMSGPGACSTAVEDNLDGSYSVTWAAMLSGTYRLSVLIGGGHVQGSPFGVWVDVTPSGSPKVPPPSPRTPGRSGGGLLGQGAQPHGTILSSQGVVTYVSPSPKSSGHGSNWPGGKPKPRLQQWAHKQRRLVARCAVHACAARPVALVISAPAARDEGMAVTPGR